ncbi:MAG: DUF3093 domain-containing protein [Pseudonocardiaceae bacterium]
MPDRRAPGRRRPIRPSVGSGPPAGPTTGTAKGTRGTVFDERLTVPLWWWPLGLGVAILLGAEVHMGYSGVRAWLPYLLTVPLAVAVLVRMGSRRVRVSDDELQVGPAHIPLSQLGQVYLIAPADKRRVLGPELDPAAFVQHSAWIKPLVRVQLIDPRDPTPYWIFSVRRAVELTALLRAGRNETGTDG